MNNTPDDLPVLGWKALLLPVVWSLARGAAVFMAAYAPEWVSHELKTATFWAAVIITLGICLARHFRPVGSALKTALTVNLENEGGR